ncbi:MAG: hypothetical protein MRJ68_21120, partial [Nitrospira sp.]|nr:hypothetical protein [Nitrospira sp.]
MNSSFRGRGRAFWIVGCAVLTALSALVGAGELSSSQVSTRHTTEASATQQLDHQTSRAARWGLDDSEWQRYESLKQGIRGSVSAATLSPIEVLGIHSRSTEERRRYAEQWAV